MPAARLKDDISTKDEGGSGATESECGRGSPILLSRSRWKVKSTSAKIMFAGGGVLPQWIEISNSSRTEQVNLSGWTLTVENAAVDADVSVGAKVNLHDSLKV